MSTYIDPSGRRVVMPERVDKIDLKRLRRLGRRRGKREPRPVPPSTGDAPSVAVHVDGCNCDAGGST